MIRRKGIGKGKGMGYKNMMPMDGYVHSMSAKGISTDEFLKNTTYLKKCNGYRFITGSDAYYDKDIGKLVDKMRKKGIVIDAKGKSFELIDYADQERKEHEKFLYKRNKPQRTLEKAVQKNKGDWQKSYGLKVIRLGGFKRTNFLGMGKGETFINTTDRGSSSLRDPIDNHYLEYDEPRYFVITKGLFTNEADMLLDKYYPRNKISEEGVGFSKPEQAIDFAKKLKKMVVKN